MRQMVLEISNFKVKNLRWMSKFCRLSASFSLKYDIADEILQNNEKMKNENATPHESFV